MSIEIRGFTRVNGTFEIGKTLSAIQRLSLNQIISGTANDNVSGEKFTSLNANSLIVITAAADSSVPSTATVSITSKPSLTWIKSGEPSIPLGQQSGPCYIYTAIFPAGGNLEITSSWSDTLPSGFVAYSFTNYNTTSPTGSYSANTKMNAGSRGNYATGSIYITGSNSIIVAVDSDWGGAASTGFPTVTFISSSTLVWSDTDYSAANYAAYHYYNTDPRIPGETYRFGNTTPTSVSQYVSYIFLEIQSQ